MCFTFRGGVWRHPRPRKRRSRAVPADFWESEKTSCCDPHYGKLDTRPGKRRSAGNFARKTRAKPFSERFYAKVASNFEAEIERFLGYDEARKARASGIVDLAETAFGLEISNPNAFRQTNAQAAAQRKNARKRRDRRLRNAAFSEPFGAASSSA